MPEARLRVDPGDPTPPYEQIRRQIASLIDTGALRPGERLPPLRQLAGDLGLAVGTVARAYSELEQAGLIASRRGAGTRVRLDVAPTQAQTDPAPARAGTGSEEALARLAAEYLARASSLGFTADQARRALD